MPALSLYLSCVGPLLSPVVLERDAQLNIKKSFQKQMPTTHCRPRKSLALLGGPGMCILTGSKGNFSALEDGLLQERGRVLCYLHVHTVEHPAKAMHGGCSIHRKLIKKMINYLL